MCSASLSVGSDSCSHAAPVVLLVSFDRRTRAQRAVPSFFSSFVDGDQPCYSNDVRSLSEKYSDARQSVPNVKESLSGVKQLASDARQPASDARQLSSTMKQDSPLNTKQDSPSKDKQSTPNEKRLSTPNEDNAQLKTESARRTRNEFGTPRTTHRRSVSFSNIRKPTDLPSPDFMRVPLPPSTPKQSSSAQQTPVRPRAVAFNPTHHRTSSIPVFSNMRSRLVAAVTSRRFTCVPETPHSVKQSASTSKNDITLWKRGGVTGSVPSTPPPRLKPLTPAPYMQDREPSTQRTDEFVIEDYHPSRLNLVPRSETKELASGADAFRMVEGVSPLVLANSGEGGQTPGVELLKRNRPPPFKGLEEKNRDDDLMQSYDIVMDSIRKCRREIQACSHDATMFSMRIQEKRAILEDLQRSIDTENEFIRLTDYRDVGLVDWGNGVVFIRGAARIS